MSLFYIHNFHKYLVFIACLAITASNATGAIDIKLEGIDGKTHVFSEYIGKGKWTVVNIWGPKCPPCREEMPDLVQFHDTHKDTDATVLGIAIDFPSYGHAKKGEVAAFAEDFMIDFPLLLDASTVTERLGLGFLEGLPTTYMFTPDGKLVGKQVGGITQEIIETYINNYKKR